MNPASSEANCISGMIECLKFLNNIGLWEMLSCLSLVVGLIGTTWYVFIKKKGIHRLNIHVNKSRRSGTNYTSLINIEFRNFTGKSVVICNPYFKYKGLNRDPAGHQDAYSDRTEVKFSGSPGNGLTKIDIFLRHGENASTWVPIDPKHSDEEIQAALDKKRVGRLYFECVWIEDKPKIDKISYRF